jgi:hypothetical protein
MRDQVHDEHPLASDSYDWRKAFECCGPPETDPEDGYAWSADNDPDVRRANPQDDTTSLDPFQRSDVEEIKAYANGENDMAAWLCVGKLKDGRWFVLSAGCDYTGWDCRSGGSASVAPDYATLAAYGLTDEECRRLALRREQS